MFESIQASRTRDMHKPRQSRTCLFEDQKSVKPKLLNGRMPIGERYQVDDPDTTVVVMMIELLPMNDLRVLVQHDRCVVLGDSIHGDDAATINAVVRKGDKDSIGDMNYCKGKSGILRKQCNSTRPTNNMRFVASPLDRKRVSSIS